jgi:Peptidase S46
MLRYRPARAGALALLTVVLVLPASALAQAPAHAKPGRFDFGKMWTFEYPPAAYFSSTYGFDASPEWFERARLAALRIPGCSASFVSSDGLVVTNHHCARGSITAVTRPGEHLLDDGFYAATLDDERRIPGTWADQLVTVQDVTDEIYRAVDGAPEEGRSAAREAAIADVQRRLRDRHPGQEVLVQVVPLYNGGRYSAYVFRRFRDVRLVAAAELDMGFFGGDPDNFTYPRYALDFAFYRVYDADGKPFHPTSWFTWGDGVGDGDAVFVIGNPGPTNRLQTVAQLEYQRDVLVPVRKAYYETRLEVLRDAYAADPAVGDRLDLRNRAFSLSNSLKAYTGRLAALRDPEILGLKRAAEAELADSIRAKPQLARRYGSVVTDIAALQDRRRELAAAAGAFYGLGSASNGSRTLLRATLALGLVEAQAASAAPDSLEGRRVELGDTEDHPAAMEEELLRLRLEDLRRYLGPGDPLVTATLEGRSPEGAATSILSRSVLATREGTRKALSTGGIPGDDPALALARTLEPRVRAFEAADRDLGARERELAADLGRARFEVYGTGVAPDATSSPRITDGVVKGYEYNGTLAPTHTTFFGMYDRYFGHDGDVEWHLPARWVPVPAGLDLATPLDFISTADTYGGNSGSPAVTRDLALVGLNFDRNVEGLSRDFIYLPERGRNIMVDVRAIREALQKVYHADRVVAEIERGRPAGTRR